MVALCALTLLLGFAFKARCTTVEWDGGQYASLCYNDLQPLYGARGVHEHIFPYVHGSLQDGELVEGAIEYPVLTGVFMWASGLPVDNSNAYLFVSGLLLAPFGLFVAYWLTDLSGVRALLWAAAPALVLYAFHNWDLLAVAAATLGFWLWTRGRTTGAAASFGVGAALKMYPMFFLAPLVLDRLQKRDRAGAARVTGAGVGTWLLINAPFTLLNFDGWWATYEFHRLRTADFNSIWIWGVRGTEGLRAALADTGSIAFEADRLNLWSGALTASFFAVALGFGWWRARRDGDYPFLQVCAALLASFMLWNKVHSPQYALWLLPFFVLLSVHWGWWAAYAAADLAVYVGIFRWFAEFGETQDAATMTTAKWMLVWGVRGRAALLAALFLVFLLARPVLRRGLSEARATFSSAPSSNVVAARDVRPAGG